MEETIKLKVFSISGIDKLLSSKVFKTHYHNADYVYSLLLQEGYVHKLAEARVCKAVIKRKDECLYCRHYKYDDGTECVVIYGVYLPDKTLAECLKAFKVNFNCVVLFKVDSEADGLYLYKDKKAIKVKLFPADRIDPLGNF